MKTITQLLLLTGLAALAVFAQPSPGPKACFGWILPATLDKFRTVLPPNEKATPFDSALLNEYGLQTFDHRAYIDSAGRKMISDAYQFASSDGAHAAYLYFSHKSAVGSPLSESSEISGIFGQTYAILGGGETFVSRNNYIFRFRGAAPSHTALDAMLEHIIGLDPTVPEPDECCGYFVEHSDRILLGPISLARFAPRVPLSVAGFTLGAQGRIAHYETPSGPMTRIVFQYPTPAIAQERVPAFRALPGALVNIYDRKIAVIFDPPDTHDAAELLADISPRVSEEMRFDPKFDFDGPLTLDGALTSTFEAWTLGSLIAFLRFLTNRRKGIPDHTINLRIANP